MKVAFYKGKGNWTDKLIRLWTGGIYSHCEIVIGDEWYTASWYDGGVVKRKINYNKDSWDFIEVPDTFIKNTVEFFEQTKGAKYDLKGILLNEFLPFKTEDSDRWYCSEWAAKVFGLNIKTNPNKLCPLIKNINKR